jgi:hypothetical protein
MVLIVDSLRFVLSKQLGRSSETLDLDLAGAYPTRAGGKRQAVVVVTQPLKRDPKAFLPATPSRRVSRAMNKPSIAPAKWSLR